MILLEKKDYLKEGTLLKKSRKFSIRKCHKKLDLKYLSYINEYKVILDFILLRLKTLVGIFSDKRIRYFTFRFLNISNNSFQLE